MTDIDRTSPWQALHQYWLDHHVDGRPPGWRDIDPPLEIPHLLKDLMVVDVEPDGAFRYRLIGSALTAFLGINLAGTDVAATGWASDAVRSGWRDLLAAAAQSRTPQLVSSKLPEPAQAYNHCLVLPLINGEGRTERLLIGVFYGGRFDHNIKIVGLETREVGPAVPGGVADAGKS